jgi:putative hemolysin
MTEGGGAGSLWLVALILVFLLLEGFFSGSEIALIASSRVRLQTLAASGSNRARWVLALLGRPHRFLSTTLVGTNLSVVSAAFCANELFARLLGPELSWVAVPAVVPLGILFAEIIPKVLFSRRPTRTALRVAAPLRAASLLLFPAAALAGAVAAAVARLTRRGRRRPFITKEELRTVTSGRGHLAVQPGEREMADRILDLAHALAREAMTPLVEAVTLPRSATVGHAVATVTARGYSRIPVYEGDRANVVGFLDARDLLRADPAEASLAPYLREPFFVPETARMDQLLPQFRRRRELAIVVDEHGAARGLLAVEDLMEEIVGEILDEFEHPPKAPYREVAAGVLAVRGRIPLAELERILDVRLPRVGYETLGGLLSHLAQRIPQAGEEVRLQGLRFRVARATPRAVEEVVVEIGSRKPSGKDAP